MKKEHPNTSTPSSNIDNFFEQAANISKAHAYDIVSKQVQELQEENKRLKEALLKIDAIAYRNYGWKVADDISNITKEALKQVTK